MLIINQIIKINLLFTREYTYLSIPHPILNHILVFVKSSTGRQVSFFNDSYFFQFSIKQFVTT